MGAIEWIGGGFGTQARSSLNRNVKEPSLNHVRTLAIEELDDFVMTESRFSFLPLILHPRCNASN